VLLIPVANLPPVSLMSVANLPPVSTTLAKLVSKFVTGVIDTGGNLPPVSLIPAAILPPVSLSPVVNLPAVSLIPVEHLDFQISPRIFEKIRNGPNGILWGWGKLIDEKTKSKKSRHTVPIQ
jgi:hypothetical protein